MTNSRIEMPLGLRWAMAGFLFIGLASHGLALAAEPLRKVRMAIPSIVIDFAPLWIAESEEFSETSVSIPRLLIFKEMSASSNLWLPEKFSLVLPGPPGRYRRERQAKR